MQICGGREKSRAYRRRQGRRAEGRRLVRSATYVVGLAFGASGGATAARSGRRSASPPRPPCWRGSSWAPRSRRTGASPRTSSGSRGDARGARVVVRRPGRRGRSPGAASTGRRARRSASSRPGEPVPIVLVREATLGGAFVGLAAVDGLGAARPAPLGTPAPRVHARAVRGAAAAGRGRLPTCRACASSQVGTATLRSRQLFGDFLAPTDNALEDAELAPALSDARSTTARPRAARRGRGRRRARLVARARPRVPQLRLGAAARRRTPRLWQIDGLVGEADRARAELQARSPRGRSRFRRRSSARPSATRPSRAGGSCSSAARRRRCSSRSRSWPRGRCGATSPRRAGASPGTAPTLAARPSHRDGERRVGLGGAAVGWVVGSAGGRSGGALAGAPVGAVLRGACSRPVGLLLGLAVALLAALVIAVTVSLESRGRGADRAARDRGRRRRRRGAGRPRERLGRRGRARRGGAARGAPPPRACGLRGRGRRVPVPPRRGRLFARRGRATSAWPESPSRGRRGPPASRRRSSRSRSASRSSRWHTGRRCRRRARPGAYAVPADVVVREDLRALVPVTARRRSSRYGAIPGVEAAYPVLRSSASAGPASSVSGVTVLGVPASAIRAMPLWRGDWGTSESGLPRRSRPAGRPRSRA